MIFDGFTHILFDFDGTLCESEGDLKATWRETFTELGLDLARFEAGYRTGPPTEANARSFFPEADDAFIADLCKHYRAKYYTSSYPLTVPYDGIDALLRRLKKSGKRVFMATNKNEVPLGRILDKFNWKELSSDVLALGANQIGVLQWGGSVVEVHLHQLFASLFETFVQVVDAQLS